MINFITNLNLKVYSGDRLDEVSSRCCCNLKAEDADLFIVERLDQTDQTRFPLHQEGSSLVAVNCLSPDDCEEPGLPRAHVHRTQGCPHCCVLGDGEGVLWLAEGRNERIWGDDVDKG